MAFINSDCPDHLRTRSATGVFRERALEWWNNERGLRGNDQAVTLSWDELKKLMLTEYLPPHEERKLEEEFWNLKQTGYDNLAYTTRFKQLSYLVPHLVNTSDRAIAKYIRGLPPTIRDNIEKTGPKTIERAYRLAAALSSNQAQDNSSSDSKTEMILYQATTEPNIETEEPPNSDSSSDDDTDTDTDTDCSDSEDEPEQNSYTHAIPLKQYDPSTSNRKPYKGKLPYCDTCEYHHSTGTPCRFCDHCGRYGHCAPVCHYHM